MSRVWVLSGIAAVAWAPPAQADFFDDVHRTFQKDIPRVFERDIPRAFGATPRKEPASPAGAPVKAPGPPTQIRPAAPRSVRQAPP